MKTKNNLLLVCAVTVTVILIFAAPRVSTQATDSNTPAYITKAVADYGRMPQDVWEDPTTKPADVLKFIGIKPGDKVVDFLPGNRHIVSMYWSRLFYKTVGNTGKVYPFVPGIGCRPAHVANCMQNRDYTSSSNGYSSRPTETLVGDPRWNGIDEALDVEHTTNFRNLYTLWDIAGEFAVPEQADIVWSTGHWHDLHARAYRLDMSEFLANVFEEVNTTGGVLVIADYAGKPGTGFTQVDTLHRVDKDAVKQEVEKAGFVFDGESMLWAKKDDDHTKVVPEESTPGVADMFILKFKKPANASSPRRPTRAELGGWIDNSYIMASPEIIKSTKEWGLQIWYNADGTAEEYPGMQDTWFVEAAGAICLRQEWAPITQGVIGCHFSRDEIITKKTGDVWSHPGAFAGSSASDEGGFRAATVWVGLEPQHIYPPRPKGCSGAACDRDASSSDNLSMGHMR